MELMPMVIWKLLSQPFAYLGNVLNLLPVVKRSALASWIGVSKKSRIKEPKSPWKWPLSGRKTKANAYEDLSFHDTIKGEWPSWALANEGTCQEIESLVLGFFSAPLSALFCCEKLIKPRVLQDQKTTLMCVPYYVRYIRQNAKKVHYTRDCDCSTRTHPYLQPSYMSTTHWVSFQ